MKIYLLQMRKLGNNQLIFEFNCLNILVNNGPRQTVYCNQFECQGKCLYIIQLLTLMR